MTLYKIRACLMLLLYIVVAESEKTIVELSAGKVEGSIRVSDGGNTFYAFEGIPYAEPPIGKLRFEKPQPKKPWNNVWTAKTLYKCMQYSHLAQPNISIIDKIKGDEDCLYLNIYTPKLNNEANLDVIVFIHGGAFMFNYGGFQGPEYLVDRNVVYVNFNYRLGILGFLSTEDDVVPGNNGLKDQTLALKWVKKNIRQFGGNPNSVTITGNSAGGASVNLHYLMKPSKGLFHRAISQSGSALNPWTIMERALEKTMTIADSIGCETKNTSGMVDCMKRRPARQLLETTKLLQPWLYNPFSPFGVVVDSWSSNPLFPEHPYFLLKHKRIKTDVPYIISHTNSEGLYPACEFYPYDDRYEDLDKKWNFIAPHLLDFNNTITDPILLDDVSEKIRKQYFGNENISRETYSKLIKMMTDRLFVVGIEKSAKLTAAALSSPVYFYYFTYRGSRSRSDIRSQSTQNFGASHADDMSYILKTNINMRVTKDDITVGNLLLDMWSSFINNSIPQVPSVNWLPLSKEGPNVDYLKFASPNKIVMESKTNFAVNDFWNGLPFKENEKSLE